MITTNNDVYSAVINHKRLRKMKTYIEWLEIQVENTLEDKDLQREHWAFCQALRKYRELALDTSSVVGQSEQLPCDCGVMLKETTIQVFCPKCYKTWKIK